MKDLSNYRKSYERSSLDESTLPESPMLLFGRWFAEMEAIGLKDEVNAMTVATVGNDGCPRSRVVLLKRFSTDGFTFYTNYNSAKGKAIAENPNVCLSFFWAALERQVIIRGIAEKVPAGDSDEYFQSRPLGSQLGAIISNQSEILPSRAELDNRLQSMQQEYEGKTVPRPEHWGGYLVKPFEFEFWQGRPNRLHDRIQYISTDRSWSHARLSP